MIRILRALQAYNTTNTTEAIDSDLMLLAAELAVILCDSTLVSDMGGAFATFVSDMMAIWWGIREWRMENCLRVRKWTYLCDVLVILRCSWGGNGFCKNVQVGRSCGFVACDEKIDVLQER